MSRILKRENIFSTTGHTETLRIISSYCGFSKKSRLLLTLNSTSIEDGWELPFYASKNIKTISSYSKELDTNIRVDIKTVKNFLNSYKKGLFLEVEDE